MVVRVMAPTRPLLTVVAEICPIHNLKTGMIPIEGQGAVRQEMKVDMIAGEKITMAMAEDLAKMIEERMTMTNMMIEEERGEEEMGEMRGPIPIASLLPLAMETRPVIQKSIETIEVLEGGEILRIAGETVKAEVKEEAITCLIDEVEVEVVVQKDVTMTIEEKEDMEVEERRKVAEETTEEESRAIIPLLRALLATCAMITIMLEMDRLNLGRRAR